MKKIFKEDYLKGFPNQKEIEDSLTSQDIRGAPLSDGELIYALTKWRKVPSLSERKLVAAFRRRNADFWQHENNVLARHLNHLGVALEEADAMLVSCDGWLCMCRDHFAESPAMESWAASCIERVVKIRKTLRPTIHGVLVDAKLRPTL